MYNVSIYLLILLINLDTLTSGILFEYRLRCPDTSEKWRQNSDSYICHGDKEYHCMQDQDGRYVVFCASSIWIQPDYCPEFNAKASLIDVILCQGAVDGCPGSIYLSNTVYQYPSCFRTVIRSTTPIPVSDNGTITRVTKLRYTTKGQTYSDNEEKRHLTVSTGVILGIVSGIILPVLVFLLIIFIVRRKRHKTYEEENKPCVNYLKPVNLKKEEETESSDSETSSLLEKPTKGDYKESKKEETFVPPWFYKDAIKKLREDGFIIIIGGPGSGKTTLANQIIKEFKDLDIYYTKPKQTTLSELMGVKDDIVLWDDCFGIWKDCDLEESVTTNIRNTISSLIDRCNGTDNHKALICIDTCDEKHIMEKFRQNIFNLSKNYEFQSEREYLKNKFERKINANYFSLNVGYPLLVKLIVEQHCPIEQADEFMKTPIIKLSENFYDLFKNKRDVYVTLVHVLCNTPSVNQGNMDWKKWEKLKEECKGKDKDNNDLQQDEYSQSEKDIIIYRNPKCIEMNTTLSKYLEKTENPDFFRFRHNFLARLLLRYHLENVGSKGILEVGNEEIKSVVEKLQSSLSKLKPGQLSAS